MSGLGGLIPQGLSTGLAEAAGLIEAVLFRSRSIGGFVADVTIEEIGTDELAVTEHPVQQGAAITDHSFKRPAKLMVRAAWSNSSFASLGDPNYTSNTYQAFLDLQASRQPFEVITGNRTYENMLMTSITKPTDEKTENALFLTMAMQEILIAQTQTVTVPPAANMASPQENAPTQSQGTQNVTASSSFNSSVITAPLPPLAGDPGGATF